MKKLNRFKTATLLLAAAAVLLCHSQTVSAFSVGLDSSEGPEFLTRHLYNPLFEGWILGPREVSFDSDSGPWVQTLLRPFLNGALREFNVLEVIRLDSNGATGWQQNIRTDGWAWDFGSMFAFDGKQLSLLDDGSVSTDKQTISFDFGTLAPDTWVWIWKTIDWTATGRPGSLQVASNFVPIPGAAWMLGAGLIGLVALRRRAAR